MGTIEHFSHPHQLTRCMIKHYDDEVTCFVCAKSCLNQSYSCNRCRFFIHEECTKLRTELPAHPFHPFHPLTLPSMVYYTGSVYCDACEKKCPGLSFRCERCDFDLDIDCALKSVSTRVEKFKHFSHGHPLVLKAVIHDDKDDWLTRQCLSCNQLFSDSSHIYGCEECKYFLHESCAKLPLKKKHPYHETHPLKLQVASYNYCDFCGEKVKGFAYCCDPCNFSLDMECAGMPSISSETMKKVQETKIKNFAHDHALAGSMKSKGDRVVCSACEKQCTGLTFACDCDGCSFNLHKGCAELPQEYVHFYHPRHALNLQSIDSWVFCGACEKKCNGFIFSCEECKFHLDVVCAMMAEKINHGEHIPHLSHGHPLIRTKKGRTGQCLVCHQSQGDSGKIYGCDNCGVWLHGSCTELPPNVKHYFPKWECEISEAAQTKFFPAGHEHPLKLSSIQGETNFLSCSVCGNPCVGPTYQCTQCKDFIVHKSCTELLCSIPKPSHHTNPMELLKRSRFTCAACLKLSSGFAYHCKICSSSFCLHIGCMNLEPVIKFGGHIHKLGFFENIYEKVLCSTCHRDILPCSSKEMEVETRNRRGLFRCVRCNYNLHLLCGPLPCLIKSDNHKHFLQLEDKFEEDDSGDYYCDACEKERDPKDCVYKCSQEKCPYVAHFQCMKPEVIRLLKGEQKEVELRTLGKKRICGKVRSEIQDTTEMALKNEEPDGEPDTREQSNQDIWILENLIDAFVEDKQTRLPGAFQILKKEIIGTGHASFWERLGRGGSFAKVSPFSDQILTQFMKQLEPGVENLEFSMIFFEDEELVKVERYMVMRSLAPILEQLLEKHGDISTDSELNLESKSLIFNVLCGAISSISTTQVNELSETLLHDWWNQVMMAKHAGFKVQFALDHLDEIFRAHFAFRAEEIQNHSLKELEDHIRECQISLKKLTRIRRQYKESAQASLSGELLGKAKAFEGKTVGRGLL